MLLTAGAALAQEVAVTVDDLPSHGALPPGMTRSDIARKHPQIIEGCTRAQIYGFVNAKKLELHSEDIEVTEAMAQRRFSAGHHTYAHLSLTQARR